MILASVVIPGMMAGSGQIQWRFLFIISLYFLLFSFVLSCGGGEGTLTVITVPIPAAVNVDGKPSGESPVTIVLKTGNHEVSFSPSTNQYLTPESSTVRISAGEMVKITGEYKNRFIPSSPTGSFSLADSVRYYGIKERALKDGTIFDYIDGGALVYLGHGLRETTHAVYRDSGGSELVLDIFDMSAPENAAAAFNDGEICPSGYQVCDIGEGCKSYSFEPDFLVYFHKSRYLVFLSTTNDSLKETILSYAKAIEDNIP